MGSNGMAHYLPTYQLLGSLLLTASLILLEFYWVAEQRARTSIDIMIKLSVGIE